MELYNKYRINGKFRLQFDFVLEASVRKALTLEQMLTVLRRTLRPEQLTQEQQVDSGLNADQFFAGMSGENSFAVCQGQWSKEGRQVSYYLDDAVENNPDGTITAGVLWWELEQDDPQVEAWFRQVARGLLDAEENLLLFGRI